MAVIKLSAFVTRISGKVGGSVFQMTSSGQIVKNNSYSIPQNSPRQTIAQTKIQTVSSRWLTTSPEVKDAWSAAAIDYPYQNKVGEESFYNGYQLFLKLNNNLLAANLPIITSAPIFESVEFGIITLFSMSPASVNVTIDNLVVGQTVIFYMSPAVDLDTSGTNLLYTKFAVREIFYISNTFSLIADFRANFGDPIFMAVYFIKYRIISTDTGNSTNFSASSSTQV